MGDGGSGCGCDGGCGGLSRREFVRISAGVAGLAAGGSVGAAESKVQTGVIPPAAKVPPPPDWFEQLTEPGKPIFYSGEHLRELIFPLGGIGTGTVWLHGSGRLVNWQIFNNIQKNTQVDGSFLAVRIEQEGCAPIMRVLQQQPVGPFKGIEQVEFCGQYPVALLRFRDPALPIELELEAFNPLIPHNEQDSALPCAIFTVRAINKTDKPVRVAIISSLQNAVYHAGRDASVGVSHVSYGGNVNRSIADGKTTAIEMSAQPGHIARLDPPIELMADHRDLPVIDVSPVEGLHLIGVENQRVRKEGKRVYWLRRGDLNLLGGVALQEMADEVRKNGALLILEGKDNPLRKNLKATAGVGVPRRERVFASFDDGTYGDWRRHGKVFRRPRPKSGEFRAQCKITGFLGEGLVNSFDPNNYKRGQLTSPKFKIESEYISLLVGGGNHPGQCCVTLNVGGKIKRSVTGKNSEHLDRAEWDVRDLMGQEAVIEVMDWHHGPWGHILADDIRFGNLPIAAITQQEADAWNELLDDAGHGAPGTRVGVGQGHVVVLDDLLEGAAVGENPMQKRDAMLAKLAPIASVIYRDACGLPPAAPSAGSMCLATKETGATVAPGWTDVSALYEKLKSHGALDDVQAAGRAKTAGPTKAGKTVNGALCVSRSADAHAQVEATFTATWHFPNQYYPQNDWRAVENYTVRVGNRYALRFKDATDVWRYVAAHDERLRRETMTYRRAMFDTTLPQYLVDAVAANVSILRSPTCFWTEDGTFFAFEGCRNEGDGCCPMNCNHVWGYEHTLAWMWPRIERNMRETELKFHQEENGSVHHRVEVPRDDPNKQFPPVADGQSMAVLKVYREHLLSNDGDFLKTYWPNARKAMDFAIEHWDPGHTGLMTEPQHNTHDWVVHGHNTFVGSTYLAALRAAEQMALLMGAGEDASRYRALLDKGVRVAATELYNGEYYIHKSDNLDGGYGDGCWSEQVIGGWWSRILGLGDILPADQVRSALKAVYKYNWIWTHQGFVGTQRSATYADGDDKGLLTGTWPRGGRPKSPMLHRDEAWTGIEYMVASHKLYEGQVAEALAIVKGLRERYDGRKKSPYVEIECGDYYVRAMSSWSVLLAAQGYAYNGPERMLAFDPRLNADDHRSMFATAEGYGSFEQKRDGHVQMNRLAIHGGQCELRRLGLGLPADVTNVSATLRLDDAPLEADVTCDNATAFVRFAEPVIVKAGQVLTVTLRYA